jgi:plastocyanin
MPRHVRALAPLALAALAACSDANPNGLRASTAPDDAGIVVSRGRGGDEGRGKIAMRDDCDPSDPAWAPTGGCTLRRGDVTNAEFGAFLRSPLTVAPNAHLIGHPSWRNEPAHTSIEVGDRLRVTNEGGRAHTFTEVAQFGGGRVPPLNIGLTAAPECAASINVAPGERIDFDSLSEGVHRFMCCIHPWMRATVRVHAEHSSS